MGNLVLPLRLLICSIIYLSQYVLMDIYFIRWVVIQYYFIFKTIFGGRSFQL